MTRLQVRQLLVMVTISLVAVLAGSLFKVHAEPAVQLKLPSPTIKPTPPPTRRPVPVSSPKVSRPVVASLAPSLAPPTPTQTSTQTPTQTPTPIPHRRQQPMTWGITLKPLPFPDANEAILPQQFLSAKRLGVSTVRVDYSLTNQSLNQQVVAQAQKNKLKLVFILPFGEQDIFSDQQLADNTFNFVSAAVNQFKGKVAVWQLGNEIASVALKQGGNYYGINLTDYDEARYQAVSTWLKAAERAVRQTDPGARTLATDNWTHVGFFDRYFSEGGNLDIIGWDWYSNEGDDPNVVELAGRSEGPYRLLTKLATYGKPIWLTEVSLDLGSNAGRETEQADFIEQTARRVADNEAVTGFLVYNLIQDQVLAEKFRHFGLLTIDTDKRAITGLKLAYWRYQAIISGALDIGY